MQLRTIKTVLAICLLLSSIILGAQTDRGCIPTQSQIYQPAGDTFCINVNGYLLGANPPGGVFVGANVSGNFFYANDEGTYTIIYFPSESCSLPDTLVYTIKGPPATPGPITGPVTACSGTGSNLQYCIDAVPGASSYSWVVTPNAGVITVNNECIVLDVDDAFAGNICIEVKANNECGSSLFTNCFNLTVNPTPQPTITVGTAYCLVDQDFPITVSPLGGTISGCVQNTTINPANIGIGTCTINYAVTIDGCAGSTSAQITVQPAVNAHIITNSTYCQGSNPAPLTATPSGGTFFPSNIINTQQAIAYIYTYTIDEGYGCSDIDTTQIGILPLPIPQFGYLDNCDSICFQDYSFYGFQHLWDFGDGLTSVNPCHSYSTPGTYCVTLNVTNSCGTVDTTVCIDVTCVGIYEDAVQHLSIYPNPTNGLVNINFTSGEVQSYMLNLVDVTGKVLYTENLTNFVGQYNNPLDLSRFASGMYIFRIVAEDGRATNVKIVRD